jgi:hypothetical protein
MRNMNRRAVMAGAAVLPALALPAIAANHPDAELLALGKQREALVAIYEDAKRRSRPNWDAQERAFTDLPKRPHTNQEIVAVMEQIDREFPIANPDPDEASDAMAEPDRRIMALPARTISGLAVKARLVKFSYSELWDEPEGKLDWEKLTVRKLIDSILESDEAA